MSKKRILFVALGGTISMKRSASGGITPALSGQDLVAGVPGLAGVADVEARSPFQLPGASLTLDHLRDVAALIDEELAAGFDGAVVVQGTDTIEETAFFLDCTVRTGRPVVVTGAMRGPESPGADGPANLLSSALVAASDAARGAGILVVFNDEIHAARLVRKGHTGLSSSFVSHPLGPLGHVFEGVVRMHGRIDPMPKLAGAPRGEAPPVALVMTGLGDDGRMIDALSGLGFAGAVIVAMGAGHVPAALAPKIEKLAEEMPVVLSTRVASGPVFTGTYGFPGSEIDLIARGVVASGEIGPVKARLLLQLLLANAATPDEIRSVFAGC